MLGHLPEEATTFVGRRADLARVAHLLTTHRLVTLTGPPGVGKTRLALRAAQQEQRGARHPDGVWWADLSPLRDEALLVASVSDAVDFADHTLRMPAEALCEWLQLKRVLLVLDCCERLAAPVAHLVGELLTTVPRLTILATSRQALGSRSEAVVDVPPLPLDGPDGAADLFRDRARRAVPGLALDDPSVDTAVHAICTHLEGLPLALELACAQLAEDRTVQDVAQRLTARAGARLDVLAQDGTWPQRHRALRTAIGWSHELCTPLERLLWARLSVFRGDFGELEAAEICAGGPLDADTVGRALRGLVRKSVVRQRPDGSCRMLDTLREYGAMWLRELGEAPGAEARHAAFHADLVRRADEGWLGAEQAAWYRRIGDAHADLCAALDHLLEADPVAALEMAGRVGFFWSCCGHLHEARTYLTRVLETQSVPGPHRSRALWALGVTTMLQGDHEAARWLGEQCAVAAWQAKDPEDMLSAAYLLGITYLMMGRPRAAHTVADRCLVARPGDAFSSPSQLRCRLVRVFALTGMGLLAEAEEAAAELRRICAEQGECWTRAYADYQLALIALLQGRPDTAAAHARAMVDSKYRIRDSFGIALGLDVLAAALAAQGEGEQAARVYGTGFTYWGQVGHPQRGTPELEPVRAECERRARSLIGDAAYEHAYAEGVAAEQDTAVALALLGPHP
ncbi:NB-ARC domain-containing protein [Streptomyces sp. NBC_00237]|uniref:ATP-binding protein n=1 Tax=Streptomyces sp. NBC_00237 TaxID=2975687 RepID=UPI002252C8E2|nr:NB-ARC domain-containing protein [Streptomyces sp. NBC_00237]MCX5201631.1 NB-ARC domain-containing protein [Streptomyces sp. NBC_00237]